MEKNSKSLERSRKSTIKVSNILIPAGITVFTGPMGGIAYGILKVLVEHAQDFIKDRNEARLVLFHETLLAGTTEKREVDDFFDKDIDLEEYHKLLKSAIQDDEDRKTYYYAELLRKIVLNQIPEKHKSYLIKIVRELNVYEIELLRKIYIYENFRLIPQNGFFGSEISPESLLEEEDFENQFARENFLKFCLIRRNEEEKLVLTNQALSATEALFKECDLTPGSIGREEWRKDLAFLGIPSINDNGYYSFGDRIIKILKENRISCDRQSLHNLGVTESRRTSEWIQNLKFLILVIGFTDEYSDEFNLKFLQQANDSISNTISTFFKENSLEIIKIFINQSGISYGSLFENIRSDLIININLDNRKELESVSGDTDLSILDKKIKDFYSIS
jgi:hypothetical protein